MYGVITGCDKNQEWLLPWWWENYCASNTYPVVFADFGLSKQALKWCQARGTCLSFSSIKNPKEESICPAEQAKWEARYGKGIWFCRSAWLKKPLALLESPFSIGLWIDLDCEIRGALDPIVHSLIFGADIGLVQEPSFIQSYENEVGLLLPGEISYNAGVIAFRQNASILHDWRKEVTENTSKYSGDQQALSMAIYKKKTSLIELPSVYNWGRIRGTNPEALIYHYTGGTGKIELLKKTKPDLLPLIESKLLGSSYF